MAAASSQSIDPQLRQNIEDQLERLLSQLEDIEGLKEELSAEEYEKEKQVRPRRRLPSRAVLTVTLRADVPRRTPRRSSRSSRTRSSR
tara:strand:+ start:2216 stop:2479 length:264 start_codon:yes stop_codon:yes gene_type:complete